MGQVVHIFYIFLENDFFSLKYSNSFFLKQSYEHANATNTSAMADAYINQNPEKGTEYKGNIKENDYR